MSFTVRKFADEPIVIVTIDVPVEQYLDNFRSLKAQVARIAAEVNGPLYYILDTRDIESPSYSDILIWIEEHKVGDAATLSRHDIRYHAVGTHPLLLVGVKKVYQLLGIEVAIFAEMDDALATIRAQMGSHS